MSVSSLPIQAIKSHVTHQKDLGDDQPFLTQLTQKRSLCEDCIELLQQLGCLETDLKNVVNYTQAHWLRKPGTERYELSEIKDLSEEQKQLIFQKLDKLGLLGEKLPFKANYDYLFIMGAYTQRMQQRLAFISKLAQQKLFHAKNWVFLSGERPLEEREIALLRSIAPDSLEKKTEAQALETLFHCSGLPQIVADSNALLTFVNAPMKTGAEGKLLRPNTADTFKKWQEEQLPKEGSCLIVGEQPYTLYFQVTAIKNLPGWKDIDTCGEENTSTLLAIHLDNLARIFYTAYHTP